MTTTIVSVFPRLFLKEVLPASLYAWLVHQKWQLRHSLGTWLLRTLKRVCPWLYISPKKFAQSVERTEKAKKLCIQVKEALRAQPDVKTLLNTIADLQGKLTEAEGSAMTDSLTRLLNRRGLRMKFSAAYEPLKRLLFCDGQQRRQVVSALMIDVDHFKGINDQFGHEKGDQVLTGLGALIAQRPDLARRASDMIARWGGEEFFIVLPQEGMIEAYSQAASLVSAVREAMLLKNHQVTISIGVTEIEIGELSWEEMLESLYKTADRALYKAKALGRNRAIRYSPEL